MATWILLILMIDGGVDHIEMNSQQSCIEAREPRRRDMVEPVLLYTLVVE